MTLQKSLLTFSFCFFAFNAFSSVAVTDAPLMPESSTASTIDLSKMSVREVEEATGRKLSFKEKIGFKIAKMQMKKMQKKASSGKGLAASSIDKNVYIILAILIPFAAVGLATDWQGNDWLIALLLTFLFWIPGIIYAFIKMDSYYS